MKITFTNVPKGLEFPRREPQEFEPEGVILVGRTQTIDELRAVSGTVMYPLINGIKCKVTYDISIMVIEKLGD